MPSFIAFQVPDAFQEGAFQSYILDVSAEELNRYKKIYALTVLEQIVSKEEAKQVIAMSTEMKITIGDALCSVSKQSNHTQIVVLTKPRRSALEHQ